ncbi:unnamed protein product [Ixodes hexagonus]
MSGLRCTQNFKTCAKGSRSRICASLRRNRRRHETSMAPPQVRSTATKNGPSCQGPRFCGAATHSAQPVPSIHARCRACWGDPSAMVAPASSSSTVILLQGPDVGSNHNALPACQPAPQLPPQWAVQQPQTLSTSFQPMPQPTYSGHQHSIQPGRHLCHNRVNSGFKLHSRLQTCSLPPTEDKCVNAVGGLDTARYCATGRQRNQQRCYRCNERGHLQANCPGNGRA